MEKILNQEEIDALVRVAQGRKAQDAALNSQHKTIAPCNFRASGGLSREQVRALNLLQENFARNLTHSLGAYLRSTLEVAVASIEQIAYSEFLQNIPDINFVCSIALQPLEAQAVLDLELPLALSVVDLLLGGPGRWEAEVREITAIEEEILSSAVQIICRELESSWRSALPLEFCLEERQTHTQIPRLMPPNEKVLSLRCEIRMPEVRGMLNLAFPTVVGNALIRKLEKESSYRKHTGSSDGNRHLREVVSECQFRTGLILPPSKVLARQLLHLKPGDLVALGRRTEEAAVLVAGGQALFAAQPVASGTFRAAEIHDRIHCVNPARKEAV